MIPYFAKASPWSRCAAEYCLFFARSERHRGTSCPFRLPRAMPQTHFALESIKDTQSTVSAMKGAAAAMKAEHAKLDLGEIEDLQDELEDMAYVSEEINELMGRSYGCVSPMCCFCPGVLRRGLVYVMVLAFCCVAAVYPP